jgi:twinkle protein
MKDWSDTGIDLRGKASGEVKTTCPRCSAQRKKKHYPCLNVNVDDGVWHCWHCSWSGSLKQGEYSRPHVASRQYRKPDFTHAPRAPLEPLLAWFARRAIPEAVLRRNMVAAGHTYFPQSEDERDCAMFPYRRGGEILNVKYRSLEGKLFRMEGGCERILYGLDDVKPDRLIWVEGEIDKLSLEVAGITSCVSVPDGAPAPDSRSYESKFDFLGAPEIADVKEHLIAVDGDAPGLRLRDELIRRLGPEKCWIVDWPEGCKDANDVLMQLGVDVLLDCIKDARELPIVGASGVNEYLDDIQRIYQLGVPRGFSTGWGELDRLYRVRPGDVAVITGTPNSGKSEFLDALAVNMAAAHGWRFGLYSPEQGSVAEHVSNLVEKKSGLPFRARAESDGIGPEQLSQTLDWISEHFTWLSPEEPTLDSLLTVAAQLVRRRGARAIVFDPWNEIEHSRPIGMSETEYIGNSLRTIRHFARRHQIAFFLVAHPAKLLKEKGKDGKMQYPVVSPYDISGSAHWHNKPDSVLSIWRDKSERDSDVVEVHVQKVRSKAVGRLGYTKLIWDRTTGRYSEPAAGESYRRRKQGDD